MNLDNVSGYFCCLFLFNAWNIGCYRNNNQLFSVFWCCWLGIMQDNQFVKGRASNNLKTFPLTLGKPVSSWDKPRKWLLRRMCICVCTTGTAMMPQYYNAGQTPWGIYLATPVAPQTPQATPPGQPAAPLLRGQHAVTARPMTPIQTATPLDESSTPQMHATPGMFSVYWWFLLQLFLCILCLSLYLPSVFLQCLDDCCLDDGKASSL